MGWAKNIASQYDNIAPKISPRDTVTIYRMSLIFVRIMYCAKECLCHMGKMSVILLTLDIRKERKFGFNMSCCLRSLSLSGFFARYYCCCRCCCLMLLWQLLPLYVAFYETGKKADVNITYNNSCCLPLEKGAYTVLTGTSIYT